MEAGWGRGVGLGGSEGRDVERGRRDEAALGIPGRFSGFGQSVKLPESCCDSARPPKRPPLLLSQGEGREIKGSGFSNATKCQIV